MGNEKSPAQRTVEQSSATHSGSPVAKLEGKPGRKVAIVVVISRNRGKISVNVPGRGESWLENAKKGAKKIQSS